MSRKTIVYTAAFLGMVIISCNSKQQAADTPPKSDSATSIDIGDVQTKLPQAGNVELIEANCLPCHSLRYIEMQPDLTHKAWEKTVDKMITAFGAPIRDSATRNNIIEYLYAIKGKKG